MDYFSIPYLQEKWAHAGFQKYLRNTSWLLLSRIISLVISFFVGAYIARYLGPQNYGSLNYIVSFVGLFSFLAGMGVDSVLIRDLIKYPERRDTLMGTGFVIKFFGGLLAMTVTAITSFFLSSDHLTRIFIFFFSFTLIIQAAGVTESFFQANVLAKKSVTVQISASIISAFLKLVCIGLGVGLFSFVFLYIIESILGVVGLLIAYKSLKLSLFSWKFDKALAASLLKDSWPLLLSGATAVISLRLDQVMIAKLLGSYSAGIYAVAVKLSEMWYFIPGLIISSVLPAIINSKKINESLHYSRYRKLYTLMFILPLLLSLGISFVAEPLIHTLFGYAYNASVPILIIYIWSGIPIFLLSVLGQALIIENNTKIHFFITTTGALLNVILNILLIPTVGLRGAAYATLISYTFIILVAFIFKPTRQHFVNVFLKRTR
jgi:O-antigen/teichoic acid export membrane protein